MTRGATADLWTAVLGGGVAALSLLWWLSTRRPPGLPPGPGPALPFLGHLYLMEKDPRELFSKWRQLHGDVFSLFMCGRLAVVLNGYDVIREAFVKMADSFSDRPHFFFTDKVWQQAGILVTSGTTWKEQRKVALEILRQMGMGKKSLAEKVQEEVSCYIRAIEEHQGAPTELAQTTQISVSNNICSIVFGQRFQYDDPVFKKYMHAMDELIATIGAGAANNFIPFAEYIPGDPFHAKKMINMAKYIEDTFLKPQLESHIKTYSEDNVDDFIYGYIDLMKKRQQSGTKTTLSENQLLKTTLDLFGAGTETTTTAIGWTLLYFLYHPEVQEKCYKEICDKIGPDRLPSIADRTEMTYLEATITEVLRAAQVAPFTPLHTTSGAVTFRGYSLPPGAMVIANLGSVMMDKDLWGDPENFRPERFLDSDGMLVRREELIPFGIGRRVCLGESLARLELFLYLSSLVQRFRFLAEDPENLPPLKGSLGATHYPKPYKIRAVLR